MNSAFLRLFISNLFKICIGEQGTEQSLKYLPFNCKTLLKHSKIEKSKKLFQVTIPFSSYYSKSYKFDIPISISDKYKALSRDSNPFSPYSSENL